ncbi:hypothetical protein PspLS_09404 [Pyricularia sp. CBS 133598]|nr:hypothetical protein PspLS_09404 [Pyricularia sp. CBS 133598]
MAEVDGDDADYGLRGIKELPEPLERSLRFSGGCRSGNELLDITVGIADALGRRFEGMFVNGLPETGFDQALLWWKTGKGDAGLIEDEVIYTHERLPNKWFRNPIPLVTSPKAAGKANYLRQRFSFGTMDVTSTGFHVQQGEQSGVTEVETKWANEMGRKKIFFLSSTTLGAYRELSSPMTIAWTPASLILPWSSWLYQKAERRAIKTLKRSGPSPRTERNIPTEIEIDLKHYEYYNVIWLGVGTRRMVSELQSDWVRGGSSALGGWMAAVKETREVVIR